MILTLFLLQAGHSSSALGQLGLRARRKRELSGVARRSYGVVIGLVLRQHENLSTVIGSVQ